MWESLSTIEASVCVSTMKNKNDTTDNIGFQFKMCIMLDINELTGVAWVVLALLGRLVDKMANDDEYSNYYSNHNNTNGWPKWAEST